MFVILNIYYTFICHKECLTVTVTTVFIYDTKTFKNLKYERSKWYNKKEQ